MPDWKQRLRERFEAAGHVCDTDVLEELIIHAGAEYDAAVAGGAGPGQAERRVDALIAVWVGEAAGLHRRPIRAAAVAAPAATIAPFTGVFQDLRYGFRLLRRQKAFGGVAILTMALGIGAATVLFSVAYGVLLRPLPWPDADRLVRVTETRQGRAGRVPGTVTNGTFLAWGDHPATIDGLGGWLTQSATLTGAGDPVRVSIIPTTPGLFPMLQARPLIGRLFRDDEGARGQMSVAILSYGLWQERFGARADVMGRLVQFDGTPHTIVGVMPREFVFPDRDASAWTAWRVPAVAGDGGMLVGVIFRALARLRPDATPAQAAAEATARARSGPDIGLVARALFGAAGPIEVAAVPELQAVTAGSRPAIVILCVAVGLLLMTATANVASLQLARATTRRREMALRAAIGAGQGRIVRQLLIETAIVGSCGGAAGLALAAGLQRLLPAVLPAGFPRLDAIVIDLRVLAFALTLTILATLACGLLPAWYTRRLNLIETLAEDGAAPIGGGRRSRTARTRGLIMAGQVAIACVLLIGAALLTRSLVALLRADRGYDPANVLTARLPLPAGYPAERRNQLLEAIAGRLRAVPGISHAAYGTSVPLTPAGTFLTFTMRSPRQPDVEVAVQATLRLVSPDYFAAMRIPLVAGRTLTDRDTSTTTPAVIVNRTFARQYLGDRAVGSRLPPHGPRAGGLNFPDPRAEWEVVGVVDDVRQDGVEARPQPEIFASVAQVDPRRSRTFDPILVVRTTAAPTAYVSTLRDLVHELAPGLALESVMTMEERVMTSLAPSRLYAVLLLSFGGFALLIAGVGLFGVLSFSVAQRTREIGVRAALGAPARNIVALVLRQALWIVATGVACGLAAAVVGVRLLSAFLYGVSPYDPLTFVAVPLVVAAVAAAACVIPARRAARVDPLTALRSR